jgi:DNA/RNA-binding domain of Phe-tRNA-synthetase-like protein
MNFCHSAELWRQFPQLVPGVLVAGGIKADVELESALQPWYQRARERLDKGPESEMPEISAWRRVYAQMGLKPTKYRSAGEALLRRFKREGDLPRLHPLVDLCNAVSLAFALPVAIFDLDQVAEYLEVRHATGDEQYLAFSGKVETPPAGEVIFADAEGQAHARRWTFRQSRRSIVGPQTRRVIIVTEALHDSAETDIRAVLEALGAGLSEYWVAPSNRVVLTAQAPRLDFVL